MAGSFQEAVDRLVKDVDSLKAMTPSLMAVMELTRREGRKRVEAYVEEHDIPTRQEDGHVIYTLPPEHIAQFRKRNSRVEHASTALRMIPRSFVVTLVSQFDSFLGRLIRVMYETRPELLEASDRQLTYAQLVEFSTLEDAREYIIEKEVESVLRKSHADHFSWLEKKLNTTLRAGLDAWPVFIELTERRNLFVHNDGIVTRQYLEVCTDHGGEPEAGLTLGDHLGVSQPYFVQACDCLLEIAVKLTHVAWRKLSEEDREAADNALNSYAYTLLVQGSYDLAIKLLIFGTETIKTHSSEEVVLYMKVNLAQAYKWDGDAEECEKILEQVDWSAKGDHLRLGYFVLKEQYEEASRIIRRAGSDHPVLTKQSYRDWPLFRDFRGRHEFLDAYRDVFGEDFAIEEESDVGRGDVPSEEADDPGAPTVG